MRLVERLPHRYDYVTLALGNIDGEAAGKFVRSFVAPDISAVCHDDWRQWRWVWNKGKGQVDKVQVYRD